METIVKASMLLIAVCVALVGLWCLILLIIALAPILIGVGVLGLAAWSVGAWGAVRTY